MGTLVTALIIFVVVIFILRFVGAWMLRIDEVISNQKQIIDDLRLTLDELRMNQGRVN